MLGRKRITISEAVEAYLEALVGRAETTKRTYAYSLRRFSEETNVHLSIGAVSQKMITHYLEAIQARGSLSYTVLVGKILHAFFAWLVQQRLLKRSPLDGIKLGAFPVNPIQPFSEREIESLLKATRGFYERAMILLLADTGIRASELVSLKRKDIDFERDIILVHGKGAADRVVALNPLPKKVLLRCLHRNTDGLVWPEGFNYRSLVTLVDRLSRETGVCCCHAHRFRHSWASRFLEETGDPMALKRLGGWRDWKQVERYVAWGETNRALTVHREHPIAS